MSLANSSGSFKLFRFSGIDVFLHWSWFLVAAIEIQHRTNEYSSLIWNILEYLALFALVTMHEFGHSLACRQVGGQADRIVLWPLGGVAFVRPPHRPGATLWSIAAGPLVNVVLLPILAFALYTLQGSGWADAAPNAFRLLYTVSLINTLLLVFNLMPVYPLDGGQILQSLLWFWLGYGRSLMVATIVGCLGVAALVLLALQKESIWIGIMAAFIGSQCWKGFQYAQALAKLEKAPRRTGYACPACKTSPLMGAFSGCGQCGTVFDGFETGGVCPHCGTVHAARCRECGAVHPVSSWASMDVSQN